MKLTEKLVKIQSELKAPKNQRNNFGKYNYRSLEDIVEAAKPIMNQHGCFLLISDTIKLIGERYYVEATATLCDGTDTIFVKAVAREAENKKGMDESQITGACSSYARKYAVNGLFAIDDTKDADSVEKPTEVKNTTNTTKDVVKIPDMTPAQLKTTLSSDIKGIEATLKTTKVNILPAQRKQIEAQLKTLKNS